eukprot:CAMPEP_0194369730 /NCGR_PEP_ID=MMETSP0174-20130528/18071_1 /TAXON_ID=216777 /ORGANISM="Proboscia alata, Strain PI-D3" /LENGTH=104 /DNA_ID=CAMNT_0039146843 /DNA_START=204 /DNA_END=515 /DNA_ORIENTATION=-
MDTNTIIATTTSADKVDDIRAFDNQYPQSFIKQQLQEASDNTTGDAINNTRSESNPNIINGSNTMITDSTAYGILLNKTDDTISTTISHKENPHNDNDLLRVIF